MADKTDLKYTAEHEWLSITPSTGSGQGMSYTATIGITSYAAGKLGDVVFVDLPAVDSEVAEGAVVGEIESTKSVGELFAPVNGMVTAVNDTVVDSPELVNSDPFGEGWMITVRFTELPDGLLSFDEYTALVGE